MEKWQRRDAKRAKKVKRSTNLERYYKKRSERVRSKERRAIQRWDITGQ